MAGLARLGDLSAHGGVISSAASTVLIEGRPAARVGDQHVCPMLNPGPTPHLGGPISQGVDSVLIEGRAAASLGSLCQCAAALDNLVQGAATVVSGTASALSAPSLAARNQLLRRRAQSKVARSALSSHYLDVRFCDEAGNPLLSQAYRVSLSSGKAAPETDAASVRGELDDEGRLYRSGLARGGEYAVSLQALLDMNWDRPTASEGDEAHLCLHFSDENMDRRLNLSVYVQFANATSRLLQQLTVLCRDGRCKQVWRVPMSKQADFPRRGYFFVLSERNRVLRSPLLQLRHSVSIQIHQRADLARQSLHLQFADAAKLELGLSLAQHQVAQCHSESASAGVYHFVLDDDKRLFAG